MLYCENCKVKVRTNHKYCPLCQSPLSGVVDSEENLFPEVQERPYTSKMMIRIFNFLCIAVIIISFMINWILDPKEWWAIWIAAGVVCVWVFLAVGLYKRKNLMKNAIWQLCLLTIGTVIWDAAIGWSGWSINYIVPAAGLVTMATMMIIVIVCHLTSPEYMIYFLMNCLHGILPLILLWVDCVTVKLPSILYVGSCALLLSALLIFQGRAVHSELQKKFHV